jgi:ribosome-associated protein
MSEPLEIKPDLTLPAADLLVAAVRSSGPGGQNVNKVASKIELRFDLAGTAALDGAVKERLRALARNRLDAEGRILIISQKTRDQQKNLEDAREKLKALVLEALTPPKPRRPTRPGRGAIERRLTEKRVQAQRKRRRDKAGDWE